MLVDNKFIYLSLPRRGSTSFHYSCILNGLEIETVNNYNLINSKVDFFNIDESNIMDFIFHGHESLVEIGGKFGFNYPIIAVKRDRHETFYSLYKHTLFDLSRHNGTDLYEYFKNISLNELFFYKTEDLISKQKRWNIICEYLIDKKLISRYYNVPIGIKSMPIQLNLEEYFINVIDLLITPSSYWHNNDSNIMWFDINNLKSMEDWVSNITNKSFKLKNVNSSKHIETNLLLDSEFIKKYNSIYDYYDLPKSVKTLI